MDAYTKECYDRMSADEREVHEHLTSVGFRFTTTGGGCTAYEMVRESGEQVLVTDSEDATMPLSVRDKISVGMWGTDGELVWHMVLTNVKAIEFSTFSQERRTGWKI